MWFRDMKVGILAVLWVIVVLSVAESRGKEGVMGLRAKWGLQHGCSRGWGVACGREGIG